MTNPGVRFERGGGDLVAKSRNLCYAFPFVELKCTESFAEGGSLLGSMGWGCDDGFVGWVGKVWPFWPAIVAFRGSRGVFPANGSSSAHKHERPFHVHRHGDELQMTGVAGASQIADAAHSYQRFIVAKARSTAERTLPAQALWTCRQVSSG